MPLPRALLTPSAPDDLLACSLCASSEGRCGQERGAGLGGDPSTPSDGAVLRRCTHPPPPPGIPASAGDRKHPSVAGRACRIAAQASTAPRGTSGREEVARTQKSREEIGRSVQSKKDMESELVMSGSAGWGSSVACVLSSAEQPFEVQPAAP